MCLCLPTGPLASREAPPPRGGGRLPRGSHIWPTSFRSRVHLPVGQLDGSPCPVDTSVALPQGSGSFLSHHGERRQPGEAHASPQRDRRAHGLGLCAGRAAHTPEPAGPCRQLGPSGPRTCRGLCGELSSTDHPGAASTPVAPASASVPLLTHVTHRRQQAFDPLPAVTVRCCVLQPPLPPSTRPQIPMSRGFSLQPPAPAPSLGPESRWGWKAPLCLSQGFRGAQSLTLGRRHVPTSGVRAPSPGWVGCCWDWCSGLRPTLAWQPFLTLRNSPGWSLSCLPEPLQEASLPPPGDLGLDWCLCPPWAWPRHVPPSEGLLPVRCWDPRPTGAPAAASCCPDALSENIKLGTVYFSIEASSLGL